jgi:hypothetical protein
MRPRAPFGMGGPQAPHQARPQLVPQPPPPPHEEEIALDELAPAPRGPAGRPADGGEAQLRAALSQASREVIEKIAWEVVPQLAETIIREELDRLIKERESR